MRHVLCKIAIICEKKQTLGWRVQTADVEQPREFWRQQIKNSVAHVRISPGRNKSGGFVQHNGEQRRNVNKFAIHLHVVARAWLRAEVSAGFAVNSDPARRDQFIAVPARSKPRRGEETI
jgi:hypothetical protein